jgi:hypothetical protein
MLRSWLTALGTGAATASSAVANPPYAPYTSHAANTIYNLLFCDEPAAFKPRPGENPTAWQAALFNEPADVPAIDALAKDTAQEGRIRALAYARLREVGSPVPPKKLLGVIVEVPLAGGLDVLAAFSEGGVRYINQTGKLSVLEGVLAIQPLVRRLFETSEPLVARIGPWDKGRLSPPKRGSVRLTFLVSDGLYFGEGPMSAMQREAMASPIIRQAAELLQVVVAESTK